MTDTMEILAKIAFAFYALIICGGSIMAVISRSLIRSLVGLIAVMIALAGMYLLLAAPFIAFMQILIYVGGVSVLIFFAIMLTRASPDGDEAPGSSFRRGFHALLAMLIPAGVLSVMIVKNPEKGLAVPVEVKTALLGKGMLGAYLLPFEMISVILVCGHGRGGSGGLAEKGEAMSALALFQLVALFLLAVGVFGLIWRRTLVGMLISLELMVNGAGLSIVAAAQLTPGDAVIGQLSALFVMGLAAAEATLILAIVLVVFKRFNGTRTDDISQLKG